MASQIQLTRSGTPGAQPSVTEMELGELALNYADGKLYFKNDSNNIELLNSMSNMSGQKIIVNEGDNHIGLNTISPSFLLDLGGAVSHTDNTLRINQTTGGTSIRIGSDGVANGEDITLLRVDNLDGETDSGAEGFAIKYLGTNSNNELGIFTDNGSSELQALTILQNGNIGIGTTSPYSKLTVGGVEGSDSASFTLENSGGARVHQYYNGSANTDDFYITRSGTGGSEITLKSNGNLILNGTNGDNVGIGTNAPLAPLHVDQVNNGEPGLILQGADPTFYFYDDTNPTNSMKLAYNGSSDAGLEFRVFNNTTSANVSTVLGIDTLGNLTAGNDITAGGDITATGNAIAAEPTVSTHLTTKNYVDTYRSFSGEVIEKFFELIPYNDTSTANETKTIVLHGGSNFSLHTIPKSVVDSAGIALTTSYQDIDASRINYTCPVGAKTITYRFVFHAGRGNNSPLMHVRLRLGPSTSSGSTALADTEVSMGYRTYYHVGSTEQRYEFPFEIVQTVEEEDRKKGKIFKGNWEGISREIYLEIREYNSNHDTVLFRIDHQDGSEADRFSSPIIGIETIAR